MSELKNTRLAGNLLGVNDTSVSIDEMANKLRVTFYPKHENTRLLNTFSNSLKKSFKKNGVDIVKYENATYGNKEDKIKPGIVVVEQGEGEDDNLAMLRLNSLYKNPLVSIQEGPCPVPRGEKISSQERLDSIMNLLTWNLTHIPIFVDDESWVACSATGSVTEFDKSKNIEKDVLEYFIPKTSAQVVPPTEYGIKFRDGNLDIEEEDYEGFIDDFQRSAEVWKQSGLMLAHTELDDLSYRGRLHRRLARQYVNQRSGMSYGFIARQLPVSVKPAVKKCNSQFAKRDWKNNPINITEDTVYARVDAGGKEWIVEVPEVWVLSTRSGCKKTDLDPQRDIVRMGLNKGEILFDLPVGVDQRNIQPSYDTLAILAHAAGNAIVASILLACSDSTFPRRLSEKGASISHWHGYPNENQSPLGYVIHGRENPPVSCSTPQSAIYSLAGKISALSKNMRINDEYRGDLHIEPYHGTNITGTMSLTDSANWVKNNCT